MPHQAELETSGKSDVARSVPAAQQAGAGTGLLTRERSDSITGWGAIHSSLSGTWGNYRTQNLQHKLEKSWGNWNSYI